MENTPTYPQYYRCAGKCVKVVSPTQIKVIVLPPDAQAPERFTSTYPSADRLQEDLAVMDPVGEQIFRDFLSTFYHEVAEERAVLRKAHLAEIEKAVSITNQKYRASQEKGGVAS